MAYGADPGFGGKAGCDEAAINDLRDARDAGYQRLLRTKPIEIAGANQVSRTGAPL